MRDSRAQLVERLFHQVVDLSEEHRRAFLDEQCGTDTALRRQVEAFLRHEAQLTDSFLESPWPPAPPEPPVVTIGRYTILEPIGEGGFAEVYLVEQTEPVRRRAALKLVKMGMDTRQVVARFEAERQALALLDHFNVARVFDAGTTEAGRPYFVMEHVPGVSITEHCDRQRLDLEGRLKLFMDVCHAVQHAHQKGIIHRDLKPSNVLVTMQDGRAVPKVIDFGVAKALHGRLTEKTMFTEEGQLIGTPEYMSPEQADLTRQDIDTRSDVYALGVLLYELLTGALPFDRAALRQARFGEIQRMIREQEPPKPSTRLSSLGDATTDCARQRRADPRSLVRELRGDLDWITMKALDKDRARRYATASELAADIQRHLDHVPVTAGPPSAAYRATKFVRRHKVGVAAAAFVALALVAGAAGTTWQAVRATRAQARAVALADAESLQRQTAQRQAQIAQAINEFLEQMLGAPDPWSLEPITEHGRDVKVVDVLDAAAAGVGERFRDEPLVEASIRTTLGRTYQGLGAYAEAEPHLELALEMRRAQLGDDDLDTQMAKHNLAVLYGLLGRHEQAQALYVEVLEVRRRVLGKAHRHTLAVANTLAMLYNQLGRHEQAQQLHLETLELRRLVLGAEHPDTLVSMSNLAEVYADLGRLDEAELLHAEVLDVRLRDLGEAHPRTLTSMNNLALLLLKQGRLDEAETRYVRALAIARRIMGEEHPHTVAVVNNLALVYTKQQRFEEAEPLSHQALEAARQTLGEEHPNTLVSSANLGELYVNLGRYDEALPLLVAAVEGAGRALPPGHWVAGEFSRRYGACLTGLGRYEEAEAALLDAHRILDENLGPDHERTANAVGALAHLYDTAGRPDEAAKWRALLDDGALPPAGE